MANIAHSNNAIFIVDNTFMTGALVQPLKFGADIVVNSLTKFANGHSDVVCGAATGKSELIKKYMNYRFFLERNLIHFQVGLQCVEWEQWN